MTDSIQTYDWLSEYFSWLQMQNFDMTFLVQMMTIGMLQNRTAVIPILNEHKT